jgi:hypothetical protein
MKDESALALTPAAIMNEAIGMAGLVQPQPTQCLSLPGSIRPPVDRCGLERLAALIPEDKGINGRLANCDPMLLR